MVGCVVQQSLLCVPDSTTYSGLFKKERAHQGGPIEGRGASEKISEHLIGPGSLSTFYTYRLACLAEVINEKHETNVVCV